MMHRLDGSEVITPDQAHALEAWLLKSEQLAVLMEQDNRFDLPYWSGYVEGVRDSIRGLREVLESANA